MDSTGGLILFSGCEPNHRSIHTINRDSTHSAEKIVNFKKLLQHKSSISIMHWGNKDKAATTANANLSF